MRSRSSASSAATHELDELAERPLDDAQLVAAVGRGEHAGVGLGEPELAVEGACLVDIAAPRR